jgi:hypothetical protein
MNTKVVVGLVSFCVAITGLILANMLLVMMIGEINRKRQDDSLVSYFGFTFSKMRRIFDEYRSSCPTGNKHIYAGLAFALAVAGLIGVAAGLGFLG